MKKIILFLFLSAGAVSVARAQLDPIYAQYLNNPLVMNPAFTALNAKFNAGIQYRTQWAGLTGNPVSWNFHSNIALVNNKVGAGIQVIEDQIGDAKNTEFHAMYSYKLELEKSVVAFGLQAGFMRFTNDPSRLSLKDPDDPNFTFFNEMKFNTGFGVLLKNDRYLLGLSVPRLLPSKLDNNGVPIQVYNRNVYLMGAYQIFLTERVRLRPAVLLRTSKGAGLSTDVNINLNLEDRYSAGIFTRNLETHGLLLQMKFKHYNLGYVFEIPASSSTSLHYTSHELTFSAAIPILSFHDRSDSAF
ncbi:MAG: type IX secretion system membrane protein PorP/SprF [Cyclobacteriaceae bacterium]